MNRKQAEKIAFDCVAHGDEGVIRANVVKALLSASIVTETRADDHLKAQYGELAEMCNGQQARADRAEDAVEVFRERALKAEHLHRRAQAETVVFKMFAMKVASGALGADHQRDARMLMETGPSTEADKVLAVVEAGRVLDSTIGEDPHTPPHLDVCAALREALEVLDGGGK